MNICDQTEAINPPAVFPRIRWLPGSRDVHTMAPITQIPIIDRAGGARIAMIDPEKDLTHKAVLWNPESSGKIRCKLCAHRCLISDGQTGLCAVRRNDAGRLVSLTYHRICAANADPIEKKPLFHFQPGSRSFSIATPGCNFRCEFCQNWQISQMTLEDGELYGRSIRPKDVVSSAIHAQCRSIAYTYT